MLSTAIEFSESLRLLVAPKADMSRYVAHGRDQLQLAVPQPKVLAQHRTQCQAADQQADQHHSRLPGHFHGKKRCTARQNW